MSNKTTEYINKLLELYLDELDYWQSEVDNIRIMHHETWKGSRLSAIIRQHRAGSRVEKQTRIQEIGVNTDIDYMFEVVGIKVMNDANQGSIYFKPCMQQNCDMPNSFGKIYIDVDYKSFLESHDMFCKIFSNAMEYDPEESAFLLKPGKFKENVVQNCGLDYTRNEVLPSTSSPSVAGKGAMNEYDGVPCLRLGAWSQQALAWIQRQTHSNAPFKSDWRSNIEKNVSLFLVPTGNPLSDEHDLQFRLSFSMVEIECFKQLTSSMRKMYGIVKYVFKSLFNGVNLLSSYHLKTLVLWKIEQSPICEWSTKKATEFILEIVEAVNKAIDNTYIPHFFIEKCNIFPKHKATDENVAQSKSIINDMGQLLPVIIENLLKRDLCVLRKGAETWCDSALVTLKAKRQIGLEAYIDGYLTRLLSVITFSLTENFMQSHQQGKASWEEMGRIFARYHHDRHICRIIHMVNLCIHRLSADAKAIPLPEHFLFHSDKISVLVHTAFEAYIQSSYPKAMEYIRKAEGLPEPESSEGIGISVTKFHKNLVDDKPINAIIQMLEHEHNGRCPRFYLAPTLLCQHLKIQIELGSLLQMPNKFQMELDKLESIVQALSPKVPYPGRLSYKFTGVYLLKEYKQLIHDQQVSALICIPEETFNHKRFATNFDLK